MIFCRFYSFVRNYKKKFIVVNWILLYVFIFNNFCIFNILYMYINFFRKLQISISKDYLKLRKVKYLT